MNGIRAKASTSPPVQVSAQQPQRHPYYQRGENVQDFQTSGYQNQPQFSQPQDLYFQQLGAQSQNYDIKPLPSMLGQGVGPQPPSNMYQQQQSTPPQGMRPANPPFFPGGNPQRPTRFQGSQMNQPTPNQNMYNLPIMYVPNTGQFQGGQILVNPGMLQQPRMPTSQFNPGMPSTQPGMYPPMPQQPTTYTGGYNNPAIYYNTTPQQTQRTPPGGAQPKERKNRIPIIDPSTGQDVAVENVVQKSSDSGSRSTPVGAGSSTEPQTGASPNNEIAAQFAAEVAKRLNPFIQQQPQMTTPITSPQPQPGPQQPLNQPIQILQSPPAHPNLGKPHMSQAPPHQGQGSVPPQMSSQPPGNIQGLPPPTHGSVPGNIPGMPLGMVPAIPGVPESLQGNENDLHSQNGDIRGQQPPFPIESSEMKSNSATSNTQSLSSKPDIVPPVPVQSTGIVPGAVHEPQSNDNANETIQQHQEQGLDVLQTKSVNLHKASDSVPVQQMESFHTSEPVNVLSMENTGKTVTDTSESIVDTSVGLDSSVSVRQATPEVVVSPATPVEKDVKVTLDKKIEEATSEASSVSKKDKAKKKARDRELNKKGEKRSSSVFDAYTDESAMQEDPSESTKVNAEVSEKENIQPVENQEEAESVKVSPTPPTSRETTPAEESIQKVEIKIEDTQANEDELEDGEILDEDEDTMLKYKYAEDQWSPLNPEGKKHYDREFLLQFQFDTAATSKPAGLPDIPDIILDKPITSGRQYNRELSASSTGSQDASSFDFTPKYVWNQPGGGGRPSKGLPRQPSNQKKGGGAPPRQINLSISKDIELHKAKDAWKPMVVDKKDITDDDDLYKKTRSILNKLTPQKFQTLVSQMQALPIDSEAKLKGVIDLVFEKAISEPNFSVAYANMCRCLSMFKVPSQTKPGEMVNFRAVLLTRCQREFEKDKSAEAVFMEQRKEIEQAEEGPKKDELKMELEYAESKAKRRSLGNIRFIGELFKLKMLTENIMHDCVFKLLRTKDPENLECLCRLLTTIGKELDSDKAKPRMDQYFAQMSKIVNEKKTSSRVRFMLQDVIDVRLNKWVPRRVDNNPKTIDQIHREVEQEAQEKALLAQQVQIQQKVNRGRRGPPGPGQMGGGPTDGWNTVGSRTPLKSVDRSIDPSKMKFSKQNVDETIQLGPGGGASRFGAWGRGSTGGTTGRPSQEKEKPNTPQNRFSALSKPEDDSSRRYSGVSPARGEGRGRGFGRPPTIGARHSQESEREKAVAAAKAIGSSQSMDAGRDTSRGRDLARRPEEKMMPPPVQQVKDIPAEDMEKKTKAILDEYLHILDIKEAIECVKELPEGNHHHFVFNSINLVLERSNVARKQTGHLLHDLVKNGIVGVPAYLNGLNESLEFAEDMEIDIPKIWQYYGELISPMIQDGSVQLNFLKEVCKPLLASNKAGKLLAEILHDASQREGHKKVASIWLDSGLQWTDFVPKNQVEQFLIDKKLEFTKGDSAPSTPTTGLPITDISNNLQDLIVLKKRDNEFVFDWIEANVDEPTTKTHQFIRLLMTAVCNSAIKGDRGKEKVDQNEISTRHDLLQKYLDHQPESELQALYALQALVTKLEHPKGVLRTMFDTFYDEDIISEDAFIQWEKSEEEPEGKGVALKQVVQFFAWLREAEDES